jgi:hypothetical protein
MARQRRAWVDQPRWVATRDPAVGAAKREQAWVIRPDPDDVMAGELEAEHIDRMTADRRSEPGIAALPVA